MSSILPKNERKQFDMRYHSSKVEFFRLFFGRIEDTKKTFWNSLTFIKIDMLRRQKNFESWQIFSNFCGLLRIFESYEAWHFMLCFSHCSGTCNFFNSALNVLWCTNPTLHHSVAQRSSVSVTSDKGLKFDKFFTRNSRFQWSDDWLCPCVNENVVCNVTNVLVNSTEK